MKYILIGLTLVTLNGCTSHQYDNRNNTSKLPEINNYNPSSPNRSAVYRQNSDGKWVPSLKNEKIMQQGCADNSVDCGARMLY